MRSWLRKRRHYVAAFVLAFAAGAAINAARIVLTRAPSAYAGGR